MLFASCRFVMTEKIGCFVVWCLLCQTLTSASTVPSPSIELYQIEGQVVYPTRDDDIHNIRILVDEGRYVGIPRIDGTFIIAGKTSQLNK